MESIIKLEDLEFRLVRSVDSLEAITKLLNESYKLLLDMGFSYVAASQDVKVTKSRISKAYKCYVAIYNNEIIATLSLYRYKANDISLWYNKSHVAKLGQFAVLPKYQKYGIGSHLMSLAEKEAKNLDGISELALDTSEGAHHLIKYYQDRGYENKETIQWPKANYRSLVLSKIL